MRPIQLSLLAFLLAGATTAQASDCVTGPDLIINGSFEGGCTPGTYELLDSTSTCLAPWTILTTGTVDIVGAGIWVSSDLVYSVDLSGDDPGGVSQSFATTVGKAYAVNFDLAAHPYGSSYPTKMMRVEVDTTPLQFADYTCTATGDINAMGWRQVDWVFIAESTTTVLTFRSTDPFGDRGSAIDNVRVFETCEGSGIPLCDSSSGNCPCPPSGANGAGCRSSATSGAVLRGIGLADSNNDSFGLCVTGIPGVKAGLCIKGSALLGSGNGNLVGDGLLCTAPQLRSQVILSSLSGNLTMSNWRGQTFSTYPGAANTTGSTYYQWWYRDTANTCSGQGFNFSNALQVDW